MKAAGLCAAIFLATIAPAGAFELHAPRLKARGAEIAPRHMVTAPCDAAELCAVRWHEVAAPAFDDASQAIPAERTFFLQRTGAVVIVTSLGRSAPDKSRRVVVSEDGDVATDPAPCPELVIC